MHARSTLRIVATYALISTAWIVGSGMLLDALALGQPTTRLAETLKGIGFVLVTSAALYVLIHRYGRRLAQSEAEYRTLFVSNPNPMWVYDLETLAFLAVNDVAVSKYGYSRHEFLSMTIADIRPPEDLDRLRENVAAVTDGIDEAGIWRHLTKDGTLLWVTITSHVIEFEGRRAELVLAEDVTASIEARRELELVSRRLETVIDAAPVAIVALDVEGRVTLWNPAAERMFGWTEAEVLGTPHPIVPPEAVTEYQEKIGEVFSGGQHIGLELKRMRKDGSSITVRLNSAPLTGENGALLGVLGLLEDVSEAAEVRAELERYREGLEDLVRARTAELEETNEQLAAATAAKSAFLASMSHELRTPLNSIIGFTSLLLQGMVGPLNEEQTRQLDMVSASGQQLLALIDDILDLSRIEVGKVDVAAQRVALADLIEAVERVFRPLTEQSGLVWRCEYDEAVTLLTDPRLAEQVLANLLSNAIKYTVAGSVSLDVRVLADEVRFAVADTGPGIPPDVQTIIFEEFERGPETRRAAIQGTGLGLAISSRIAALLGGRIELSSIQGEGSIFTFVLPASPTSTGPERV